MPGTEEAFLGLIDIVSERGTDGLVCLLDPSASLDTPSVTGKVTFERNPSDFVTSVLPFRE